jgi:3-hydroxyanthranilate 3,4-dioxygenase
MHVNLMTDDGPARVDVREGEMWVLPRNVPHSPQRPEPGSIGLVIERVREEGTREKFRWYCGNCGAVVHEVELQVRDIVTDLPPLFTAFYESDEARTCGNCGALHPGKGSEAESTGEAVARAARSKAARAGSTATVRRDDVTDPRTL